MVDSFVYLEISNPGWSGLEIVETFVAPFLKNLLIIVFWQNI